MTHETLAEVREGLRTSHWTPEVMATAVWPLERIIVVETAARDVYQELCDHFDPLWPMLFGWTVPSTGGSAGGLNGNISSGATMDFHSEDGWARPRWAKPVIREVA